MTDDLRERVTQRAYDLAYEYEHTYRGCSQCVLGALQDTFGMPNGTLFRAMTGFAGGGGAMGDAACGAYSAGIAFLSSLRGRDKSDFVDAPGERYVSFANTRTLHRKFIDEYGTAICRDIHMKVLGRPFFLPDPDEARKFDEAGAHETGCPEICGKAARWAAEIAIDQGLIPEEKLRELAG